VSSAVLATSHIPSRTSSEGTEDYDGFFSPASYRLPNLC
jgi:hypothetical protein